MNILLIGASGMIGSRILKEALSRGHKINAAARNSDKIPNSNDAVAVALDVNDPDAVAVHAAEADIVISAVSPRNTGNARRDAETFTKSLIDAQKKTGKRLLMVGGASTLQMPDGTSVMDHTPEAILPEAGGMRRAYAMLIDADTDFAVLAPAGMIEPGERTGKFRLGGRTLLTNAEGGKGSISAEDFAVALMDEAEKPRHFRTIFNVGY